MYRQIFTYPVFVATALLVLHSWLFRGRRNTLLFWGAGYVVAFCRELAYQNIFPSYRFTGAQFKLFNVPLTIPAGWLFEAYISLYLAQIIMGADLASITEGEARMTPKRYGARVLPIIGLSCVVTGTIAFAIENTAVRMHWWHGRGAGDGISPGWIPGHMFTVFWLTTLLLYITHEGLRLRRNLLYVGLALAFTAVVELVDVIGPAAKQHAWVMPLVIVIVAAYFASLFMWRRLLLFFTVFALAVMGDNPAALAARLLGKTEPRDTISLWLLWNMSVVLIYGLYLFKKQRPEIPVTPRQLL